MTEPELAPLDPELRALVDHERARPGIPDAALARMRDRLAAAIPAVPAFATPPPPRPSRARGWLRALPVAAAGLALGGVVGALVHARLAPPPPPPRPSPYYPEPLIVNMPIPLPVPIFLLVTTPAPVPLAPPAPRPVAPIIARTPSPTTAPPPGHDTNLAAERALLDTARTALARRDLGAGLDALARHGDLFPDGQLAEERDSLWIQALIAADKPDAARARAAKFREQFPHSLLLPVVDAALRTIP